MSKLTAGDGEVKVGSDVTGGLETPVVRGPVVDSSGSESRKWAAGRAFDPAFDQKGTAVMVPGWIWMTMGPICFNLRFCNQLSVFQKSGTTVVC